MNQSNQIKKTALYCRLSQDDGIEGDSNSIQNQKTVIHIEAGAGEMVIFRELP